MGTIPSEISTLTNLNYLYVPSLIKIIECWLHVLLSVGHVRLSLSLSSFFYRLLDSNALTGTIPPQISTLTKLTQLYAHVWTKFSSAGHTFY